MYFSLIFLLSLYSITIISAQKQCRALVLEGGGDMGAYQAGVLSEMSKLIPSEVQYDVISGISVGALNAAGLAQFAPGDEKNATDFLLNVWRNIVAGDVYQDWPGDLIDGLLFRSGLYDTSPLVQFLDTHFTKPIQRKITVGTCSANTGELARYTEALSREDLLTAVRASSAFPVVFPYVSFNNDVYIDGGTILNLDVEGAVLRCREIVDNDKDIIVDVILCSGAHLNAVNVSDTTTTIPMLGRFLQIYSYANSLDDFLHAKEDITEVQWRYFISPSQALPSGEIPLGFKPAQIEEMINIGIQDAQNNVKKGAVNMTEIINEWNSRRNNITRKRKNKNA